MYTCIHIFTWIEGILYIYIERESIVAAKITYHAIVSKALVCIRRNDLSHISERVNGSKIAPGHYESFHIDEHYWWRGLDTECYLPYRHNLLFIAENCWLLIAVSSSNYVRFTVIIPRYLYTHIYINIYTGVFLCVNADISQQSLKSRVFNSINMLWNFSLLGCLETRSISK